MRIELREVGKRFGRVVALSGVTAELPAGARVALVGPNGSGKSTLTRILMGLLSHEGDVRVDGRDPLAHRAEIAQGLAYVPQIAPAMGAQVGELVRAVAEVRGLDKGRLTGFTGRLGLDLAAVEDRPFRGLSGGTRQKVLIALALAARARLLILDEPTASLDPAARTRFYELCSEHLEGATLILGSHRLEEIRHMVDHVLVLSDGRLSYDGPAAAFLARSAAASVQCLVEGEAAAAWLQAHGFARGLGGWWARTVPQGEKLGLLGEAISSLGGELRDITVRDLETIEAPGGKHG